MTNKQLSEFEKGQIVAYNDYGLSFYDIAKEFNWYHSSIDVFLKNYKKTGNQNVVCGDKRKDPLHLILMDTLPNIKWL